MELPPKGSLIESGFIKLLLDCVNSRFTGMIRLETGPVIKVIYLQQGNVAFASSNEKSDRLTEVLKRAGKLNQEQIDHAQARLKPNVSLGKTLVELGYISPKDLLWGARMQVETILHQLLFWDRGNYQIIEGPLPKEIVSLNMAVPQIIFDGILKGQDREWVLQRIGSPESVFLVEPTFHEKNAVYKLPVEDTVSRMNGKRSLEEIAQATGKEAFEVCKAVAALQILGMVQRAGEPPEPVLTMIPEPIQGETPTMTEMPPLPSIAPRQDISLGQILQLPTVEELQQEAAPAPTLIVPPAAPSPVFTEPAPRAAEPPEFQLPKYEPLPEEPLKVEPPTSPVGPVYRLEEEEEEDTETLREHVEPEFRTRPHGEAEPTQRFQPPGFGDHREVAMPMESMSRRSKRPEPRITSAWNWKKITLVMGLLAAVAIAGTFVYTRYLQRPPQVEYPSPKPVVPSPGPAPGQQASPEAPAQGEPAPQEATSPEPSTQQPPVKEPEPATPEPVPAKPEPAPEIKAPAPSAPTPAGLLKSGRIADAARSWKKALLLRKSQYTIQLEIACQENTVLEAFQILNDSPQISVVPLDYKGKACYRVLYGVYPTTTEAESDRARLPQDFLKQQSPAQVIPLAKALK